MDVLISVIVVVLSLAFGGWFGSWTFQKVATRIAASDYRANQAVEMGVGPNAKAVYVPPQDADTKDRVTEPA